MSRKKASISELDLSKIGGRVAYIRLINGLTQAEFSKKTGFSRGNVSGLESHKYEPSFRAIVRLIELFNIDPNWLLFGSEANTNKNQSTDLASELPPVVQEHLDIIKKFEDPVLGKNINEQLVVIQNDKNIFKVIIGSIKSAFDTVSSIKSLKTEQRRSGSHPEPNMENMDKFQEWAKKPNSKGREGGKKEGKTGTKDE